MHHSFNSNGTEKGRLRQVLLFVHLMKYSLGVILEGLQAFVNPFLNHSGNLRLMNGKKFLQGFDIIFHTS